MNLQEQLQSRFATKSDLLELQKAMDNTMQTALEPLTGQSTGTAESAIVVDYDEELQKTVFHQSPFLSYLEQAGCVSPASVAKVGYRVKNQKTKSSFIPETADIPEHDPSIYEHKIAKMQTLVYPIEVSDLAIRGVDAVDVLKEEIVDGYADMAQTKDISVMQGNETSASSHYSGFEGVLTSIKNHGKENPTVSREKNLFDNDSYVIDKETIDVLAQNIIDNGGNPSAILTSADVGRQLNDILYPNTRTIDQVDLTLGTRVTAYHAPNGQTIPIIVDPNIDRNDASVGGATGAGNERSALAFIDNRTLRMRELVKPSVVDLAKTKLSNSKVLFTYFTFYNRAVYRNGMIYNIGTEER